MRNWKNRQRYEERRSIGLVQRATRNVNSHESFAYNCQRVRPTRLGSTNLDQHVNPENRAAGRFLMYFRH
jgi:hypothetical protein